MARGYLNNPEKTAEVFVEDPAWVEKTEASGRWGSARGVWIKDLDMFSNVTEVDLRLLHG